MIIKVLRKNIGTIIAFFGFVLLCIITFGDLGEFLTDAYWQNVLNNLTSIGFLSVALTLIQVAIKQGLAEQALQTGLNTPNTTAKMQEHKNLILGCRDRMIYLPYFLAAYNKRHTLLKKREFLVDNNFSSEQALLSSKNKKMIKLYHKIKVLITAGRIKWATTDIKYNKHGQIITLQEHRANRISSAIMMSILFMVGVTLLTRGLFFDKSETPLYEKFIKLITYVISIAISSIFSIIKEYEKGAFGVPNDLDEINEIWTEFSKWEVPQWVVEEVKKLDDKTEVRNEQKESKTDTNGGANLQDKQEESKGDVSISPDSVVSIPGVGDSILLPDN